MRLPAALWGQIIEAFMQWQLTNLDPIIEARMQWKLTTLDPIIKAPMQWKLTACISAVDSGGGDWVADSGR